MRARSLGYMALGLISAGALAACANDYTCADYQTCPGADAAVDSVSRDAKGDAPGTHHDGGTDARMDGRTTDGDHADGETPDATKDVTGDSFACDPSKSPSEEPCVVSETYGVFVAPTANGGSDATGTGSRTAPYATLSHAVASLGTLSRVYVCNGAYTDQVTLSGAVSLFGGLTCGAASDGGTAGPWAYAAGTKATVTGSSPGFVLEVNTGSATMSVEDLEFDAAPGTASSTSSIALFAVSSTAATLRRVTLTAAAGFDGASGTAGGTATLTSTAVNGVALATPSLNGQAATATAGGPATTCTCSVGGTSAGGAGGTEAVPNGQPGAPTQGMPTPAGATGGGGTESACSGTTPTGGVNGSNAFPTVSTDGPAATVGTTDGTGWHPGGGGPGADGNPGQGGGGGGAVVGGFGGGGGCGGCGGLGGGNGEGGGGSIALLAYDSPVDLVGAVLSTMTAGAGGSGASGGPGMSGGARGSGSGLACNGGNGGTGSTGGAGGGGAGGVSIGILYAGTAPTTDATTQITPGSAGAVGTGGDPGMNDGALGVSAMTQNASAL